MRPILLGLLHSLHRDRVSRFGGYENITLWDLAREFLQNDGHSGVCFEYAVHDAVRRADPLVMEPVEDVLTRLCNIDGDQTSSILFGAEKAGSLRLVETAKEVLTPDSVLLYGGQGRPVLLRQHIDEVATAFRTRGSTKLPRSIAELWKADLFLGRTDTDRWVGTSVKINADRLEGARGLRVGIVPAKRNSDAPYLDERRNLAVCPLRQDGAFMEVFDRAWWAILWFLDADAKELGERRLPWNPERQLIKLLAAHRETPVVDAVDQVLRPIAQPELLATKPVESTLEEPDLGEEAESSQALHQPVVAGAVVAPVPQATD